MNQISSKFIELSNGQKIHYREENAQSEKEEVILLIHGNYSSIKCWEDVIEKIKKLKYRIIAVDLRGFGKSSYQTKCSRFKDWAEDIIEILNLLKIEKTILNGWSFGGAISQKISQLVPEKVSKLILTCSVSHQGLVVKNQEGVQLKTIEQISKIPKIAYALKILDQKNYQGMRQIFDLLLYSKMLEYPEERKIILAKDPFDQRCYRDLLEALANSDIDIAKIKAKTLLIHGAEDNVLPPQTIMLTAQKLGKLQLWQGLGHMIPLENLEKYIQCITSFIVE